MPHAPLLEEDRSDLARRRGNLLLGMAMCIT